VGVVVHEDRDVVAELEAAILEQMGQSVGTLVELAVRHHQTAARHDVGRIVGVLFGVQSGPHGPGG
jgi:hypothetical protein